MRSLSGISFIPKGGFYGGGYTGVSSTSPTSSSPSGAKSGALIGAMSKPGGSGGSDLAGIVKRMQRPKSTRKGRANPRQIAQWLSSMRPRDEVRIQPVPNRGYNLDALKRLVELYKR